MTGWTESAKQIEARKRAIIGGRLLPSQRRGGRPAAQPAPVEPDRLSMALAIKRQYDGITPVDVFHAMGKA